MNIRSGIRSRRQSSSAGTFFGTSAFFLCLLVRPEQNILSTICVPQVLPRRRLSAWWCNAPRMFGRYEWSLTTSDLQYTPMHPVGEIHIQRHKQTPMGVHTVCHVLQ